MTNQPYTDDDLCTEAARQHGGLADDPDFMGVGEAMNGDEPWSSLGRHDFATAQRKIHDLIGSAADLSDWAVHLGADGLEPSDDHVTVSADSDGQPLIRVHFAFLSDMPTEMRADFIAGIAEVVTGR